MAKFCKKCGNQLNDNAKFCHKCGTKFEAEPTAPQQAAQQPMQPKVQPVQQQAQPAAQNAAPAKQPEAPKKKKKFPVAAIVAIVLVVAIIAGYFAMAGIYKWQPLGDNAPFTFDKDEKEDEDKTDKSEKDGEDAKKEDSDNGGSGSNPKSYDANFPNRKEFSPDVKSMSVGDKFEFGYYPQTKVTDSSTISALEAMQKNWTSYEYYSGTGDWDDGNMKPSDYMKYADLTYNGEKYRAVTFTAYRPVLTGLEAAEDASKQPDNGYTTGNVYYFRYEPLQWRVLDPATGYVMCDIAIDAQAYNNFIVENKSDGEYYGDSAQSFYASDWENCSLRKWLNEDFYNTAFTSSEQSKISTTSLSNKSTYDSEYDSADTSDKIFLLSYDDVLNSSYGFSSHDLVHDTARQLKSTDYAKCQGCYSFTFTTSYLGNTWWRLRSPYSSGNAISVSDFGEAYSDYSDVDRIGDGIVPAFKFN